jgi:hypothetical protein
MRNRHDLLNTGTIVTLIRLSTHVRCVPVEYPGLAMKSDFESKCTRSKCVFTGRRYVLVQWLIKNQARSYLYCTGTGTI